MDEDKKDDVAAVEHQTRRERQREVNNLRNRLHSIAYDVDNFLKPVLRNGKSTSSVMKSWPLFANQRCGSWYTGPITKSSCYFKSMDGHVGTWNFSLKRLNLPLFQSVLHSGGCWLVDASRTKAMPDSFSRTIPIWATVLNRIIAQFRREAGEVTNDLSWDEGLYTPSSLVSAEEHAEIISLLDDRVKQLKDSGIILKPEEVMRLQKPLRTYWIFEDHVSQKEFDELAELANEYSLLVCVSCGFHRCSPDVTFTYSPGAADDEESWARGLTAETFWRFRKKLLKSTTNTLLTEIVEQIVSEPKPEVDSSTEVFNAIGHTGLFIGSRAAGKPPTCWENFDAILNVSELEYEALRDELLPGRFYLQMPVAEGKRDKTELERWLAVGIVFACYHLAHLRKVLIHCAQGRDRSVAVAISVFSLFVQNEPEGGRPLCRPEISEMKGFVNRWSQTSDETPDGSSTYRNSGLPKASIPNLLGRRGRDELLNWYSDQLGVPTGAPLASKTTLRLALYAIQAFRAEASPSRSTFQKLNRFFMSDRTMYDKETTPRTLS